MRLTLKDYQKETIAKVGEYCAALADLLTPAAFARLRALAGRRLTGAGEIHIAAETSRTQEGNRADALRRLRDLIVAALHEPKPRRKTKPSRAAKQRRMDSKKRRGQIKSLRRSHE